MGERATPHWWWNPTRVLLLLTAVVFAVGVVQKAPCSLADGKDQNWVYSHMCYTDLRPLYVPRGLAEHSWPYTGDEETRARYEVMEYPVGIAYWAWGTSWVTHWLNGSPDLEQRYQQPVGDLWADEDVDRELSIFMLVNAIGFAILALLTTWLLARTNRGRPWDAAAFALSPMLLLTGMINWDLLAVALVAGALWAWSRDRPVLTGVLIGLGTAVKLYPLFLLGGVLILCLRQRRYVACALAFVWAGIVWAVANAPAYLSGREQWKVFWEFNADRGADLGSLWLVIDQARAGSSIAPETINKWSWVVFGAWCVGVFVLGMLARSPWSTARPDGRALRSQSGYATHGVSGRSPRWFRAARVSADAPRALPSDRAAGDAPDAPRPTTVPGAVRIGGPRLAQLGYLVVVGFLIVNKVYSPQYVLWLLPLAVLARPRWRDQIIWQAGELFYFCSVWWYLGGYLQASGNGEPGFYWIAIVVRVLAELYLAAVIVRDMFVPDRDPVAVTAADDSCNAVLRQPPGRYDESQHPGSAANTEVVAVRG